MPPKKSVKKETVVTKAAKLKGARPAPKEKTAKPLRVEAKITPPPTAERYWEAVGRRKTAVARIRLFTKGERGIWVNGKPLDQYFSYPYLQKIASEAMELMKSGDRFHVLAKVGGGGIHAQAEAVRHGMARTLVLFNADFRKRLKKAGVLTRDPRMKERKKFGLKGARRAPQWQKR